MKEELEQAFAAIKNGEEEQARVLLARMLKDDPEYVPGWVLLSKLAPNRIQKAAFLDKILALDPAHIYARQEMEALEAGISAMPEVERTGDLESEIVAAEVAEVDVSAGAAEPTAVEPAQVVEELVARDDFPSAEEAEQGAEFVEEEWQPEQDEVWEDSAAVGEETRMPISADPLDYEAQATGDTLPPWLADDEALLIDELAGDEIGDEGRMPPEPDMPDWLTEEPAAGWQAEEKPVGGAVRLKDEAPVSARERRVTTSERLPTTPAAGAPPWLLPALAVALVIVFVLLIYFGIRLLG